MILHFWKLKRFMLNKYYCNKNKNELAENDRSYSNISNMFFPQKGSVRRNLKRIKVRPISLGWIGVELHFGNLYEQMETHTLLPSAAQSFSCVFDFGASRTRERFCINRVLYLLSMRCTLLGSRLKLGPTALRIRLLQRV